ncbi:MAG: DUF6615 family protein [Parasphingorhabdus sp.]|uniref:DUF6615 family protein n=1 Tax=Parasphingorhabdus sp. TaxID=2709688 RepID=UPI0030033C71
MLCEFSNRFPRDLAIWLERDRHLTRNFREETTTDMLMAGLIPLEPLGVRVDFPDETVTGADMDWIYAAPHEVGGGSYLRLMIQAKRCKEVTLKDGSSYWYYAHLDYGTPKGSQAATLVSHAATSPGGMETLPLYMFYHPLSSLQPATGSRPAVEGINLRLARDVVGVVAGGCARVQKTVGHWRNGFFSLSDLLCFPLVPIPATTQPPPEAANTTQFVMPDGLGFSLTSYPSAAFHPTLVADRINDLDAGVDRIKADEPAARPAEGIPDHIRRAIEGNVTEKDRKLLKRPRVIFSTSLTRENPLFDLAREASQSRRRRDGSD